ncbi:high-affinity branched-chain amino acid ABC transporter membrane protein [Klebsiella pneumoniae]|uniref:High-affinity branched-chain amino acid ABC transporter membrane protein n=1 Tax=Klebsiella pneumoniae TaxID=573 RepID=A0A3S4GV05_KLEPN|nr:high-affinity branched-chain amino acid ABC transporter membrane protein [Klebsiella pneumoniae]
MTAVDRERNPGGRLPGGWRGYDGVFSATTDQWADAGAVYGLIAIGYTMVYGIIGMINFAHGEVYMVSAYLCAIGLALLSFFGIHSFPLLIFATLVFTIVVTGVYGWAIERIAYRPLRNSTRLAPLISAIGMSLILQNYVQLSQGAEPAGDPDAA